MFFNQPTNRRPAKDDALCPELSVVLIAFSDLKEQNFSPTFSVDIYLMRVLLSVLHFLCARDYNVATDCQVNIWMRYLLEIFQLAFHHSSDGRSRSRWSNRWMLEILSFYSRLPATLRSNFTTHENKSCIQSTFCTWVPYPE